MIRLDLNNPDFQSAWLTLDQEGAEAVLGTLRKISRLTWPDVYRDRGLRWEAVKSRRAQSLYTIRISKRIRAVVRREGDVLKVLSLHPDHDSAYE